MQTAKINVQTENIFPIIKKFLYSDHEIFLRELVSNAVDATKKLKALSSLGEFNQSWAKSASALVVVGGKTTRGDGKPHADYQYDCGLAAAQLVFETHHRGMIAHQMTGFDREIAHQVLEMASDVTAVVVIAIGFQDVPEKLSGPLLERELAPRTRLPLEEIVVQGLPL